MVSLGTTAYVKALHYESLIPAVSGTNQNLQEVTDNGNTTTDAIVASAITASSGGITATLGDVTSSAGRLVGDRITPAAATFVDITTPYRGNKVFFELPGSNPAPIGVENCKGDLVAFRAPSAATIVQLPTAGVEIGDYVILCNNSQNSQRVAAGAGGSLDTVANPGFITFPDAQPYVIEIFCVRAAGGNNTWFSTFKRTGVP